MARVKFFLLVVLNEDLFHKNHYDNGLNCLDIPGQRWRVKEELNDCIVINIASKAAVFEIK